MGRSKRYLCAAVALILGTVGPALVGFAAPVAALTTGATTGVVTPGARGHEWPAATKVRIEAVGASPAVTVDGLGTYRGAIEVSRTRAGIAVINEVAFEDYVKGISEVPSAWPLEALKAQAIAARTYALWDHNRTNATAYRLAGAHICATQSCQVYTGIAKEQAPEGARWTAAVEATRNEVLWWRGGPIVAKYSSSNGGQSVPGGQPYLRAVNDPDDRHSPLHQWTVTVPADHLAAALDVDGRVVAIQRVGDDILVTASVNPDDPEVTPSHRTLNVLDFRDRVNGAIDAPPHVPKTLPTVRFAVALSDDGTVRFDGRGWGHGIGMSQWGAFGKAARGMKAPDILANYYAGLKPVRLPESQVPKTVRVALSLEAAKNTVRPASPGTRLRVTTDDGSVIAHGSSASWTVRPAKRGLTIGLAPTAPNAAPAVEAHGLDPVDVGEAIRLRLRLSEDAHLALRATRPGDPAPVTPLAPSVVAAGDLFVDLPPASAPGEYVLVVDADAGGGRVTTARFTVPVASATAGPLAAGRPPGDGGPSAVAAGAATPGPAGLLTSLLAAGGVSGLAALAVLSAVTRRVARLLGQRRVGPLH